MRDGYRGYQIALHSVIAGVLPVQYLTGGSIERTHHAVHMGVQPSPADILQHLVHNYAGIATVGSPESILVYEAAYQYWQ
ncbi:hypothetical protein PMI09_05383 [Rhizobium sp. CF122]|nr:hypothetical protein PMI09_05383 [Rhizobium sp. CF122]